MAWHLYYLVKANMVELSSLLPMDSVDRRDKLAVTAPPAILLAEDYTDGLLTEGVACREVEQLPCSPVVCSP